MAGAIAFAAGVLFLLFHAEPVEVTGSHLEASGGQAYVEGEVRNGGREPRSIKLELRYYDQSGHAVTPDTIDMENLPGGAVRSFRGPPHDAGTISSYSIYLNEGRNPYGN
ncbi:MAG: FxLYD domain-containing protein [Candidatus Binataceae bacterium]